MFCYSEVRETYTMRFAVLPNAPTKTTEISLQPDHVPCMRIAVSHSLDIHSLTTCSNFFDSMKSILCKEDALRRSASWQEYPTKPSSSPASYPTTARKRQLQTQPRPSSATGHEDASIRQFIERSTASFHFAGECAVSI